MRATEELGITLGFTGLAHCPVRVACALGDGQEGQDAAAVGQEDQEAAMDKC